MSVWVCVCDSMCLFVSISPFHPTTSSNREVQNEVPGTFAVSQGSSVILFDATVYVFVCLQCVCVL